MRAQLELERDEAVAAARDELREARAERGALYAHFRSEAAKTETVARARLAGELAEAEEKFAAFWKGKTERLQKAHDDKYAQLWADRTREVANLKKDLKASREAMLADERAAWAEERAAVRAGHERAADAARADAAGERRALRGLMASEAAGARARRGGRFRA